MSSGLPCLVTNYSGPAAFLSEENAFPIRVARLGPDLRAEPDVAHLRQLMRAVASDPEHARAVGMRARAHVEEHYSAARVGEQVVARLAEIG